MVDQVPPYPPLLGDPERWGGGGRAASRVLLAGSGACALDIVELPGWRWGHGSIHDPDGRAIWAIYQPRLCGLILDHVWPVERAWLGRGWQTLPWGFLRRLWIADAPMMRPEGADWPDWEDWIDIRCPDDPDRRSKRRPPGWSPRP